MTDLVQAWMAGAQLRRMREEEERQKRLEAQQDQLAQRQAESQAAMPAAMSAAQGGDFSALAQLDPNLALRMQQEGREQVRLQMDQGRQQAELAQGRAAKTAQMQAGIAKLVAGNPNAAGPLQARVDELARTGVIDRFDVAGRTVSFAEGDAPIRAAGAVAGTEDVQRLQQQAQLGRALGPAEQAPRPTGDMIEYSAVSGLQPGDEQFGAGFARWKERNRPERDPAKLASELRREFQSQPVYKDTHAVASAYEKIATSSATGPGDMRLIFGYMKMMDPGSTVREGEFATAENAGGISDRVRSLYNKAISGEMLQPGVRDQFKTEARDLLASQIRQYEVAAKEYRRLAESAGVSPADVVLNPWADERAVQRAAAPRQGAGGGAAAPTPKTPRAAKIAEMERAGIPRDEQIRRLIASGDMAQEEGRRILQALGGEQ